MTIGIPITGIFVPQNDGYFPLLEDKNLKGGWRVVADLIERNAIPDLNRKIGMVAYAVSDGYSYQLIGGISNSNWQIFSSGSSSGGSASAIQETITVTSNGQTSFTLTQMPSNSSTVEMFINGSKQQYGIDYIAVSTAATYTGSISLLTTDIVEFWYLTNAGGSGGGGSQTLAQTLVLGNSTGGTNIKITDGDSIIGTPGAASAGGDISITAGAGSANFSGGSTFINAGAGVGNASGGFAGLFGGAAGSVGTGGFIGLSAGDGGTASGAGGSVSVLSGNATNGSGGDISIECGDTLGGNNIGGNITVNSGGGVGTGVGGAIQLTSGDGYLGNAGVITLAGGNSTNGGNGGFVFLAGGNGDTGIGGGITLQAGTSNSSNGGGISITSGDCITTGSGGGIVITAGLGGSTLGDGGDVSINAGNSNGSAGDGGSVIILAGLSASADGSGGNAIFTAGDGSGTGNGGIAAISAGSGASAGVAVLSAGLAIDGDGGFVALQASPGTIGFSDGSIYIRLVTTNDATPGFVGFYKNDGITDAGYIIFDPSTSIDMQLGRDSGDTYIRYTASPNIDGTDGSFINIISQDGRGNSDGGNIIVTAGNSGSGDTGNGGDVKINGGNAVGADGYGGNIILTPGLKAGLGLDGVVHVVGKLTVDGLIDPTGLVLDQQATVPYSPAALSKGTVWVKNYSPNSLMFTDGYGIDHNLLDLTITPPSFSTAQTDYEPAGWASARYVRLDVTANADIYSFSSVGLSQKRKTLINVGGDFDIRIHHDSYQTSVAANRVQGVYPNDMYLLRGFSLDLWYDDTSLRWRPV